MMRNIILTWRDGHEPTFGSGRQTPIRGGYNTGGKNSVLPILAATLLTADTVVLRRCPRLKDVEASIRILEALGCTAGGRTMHWWWTLPV